MSRYGSMGELENLLGKTGVPVVRKKGWNIFHVLGYSDAIPKQLVGDLILLVLLIDI